MPDLADRELLDFVNHETDCLSRDALAGVIRRASEYGRSHQQDVIDESVLSWIYLLGLLRMSTEANL